MKIKFAILAASLASLSSIANGQITNTSIQIGGPLSLSSEGAPDFPENDNPGVLNDGETLAEAVYDLTLNRTANPPTLTVRVFNTSPVLTGVCNPVLVSVYFNAPEVDPQTGVGVTDMTLVSTTWAASSPSMPNFTRYFDGDSSDGFSNEFRADGFGNFNLALLNDGNMNDGGISNPAADTVIQMAAHGHGPTFTFELAGDLTDLTADDFADELSTIPPGWRPQNAVGKFQGGGPSCDASGFISNDNPRLYVELDFFRGAKINGGLLFGWRTLAEIDNVGFNLYRQPVTNGLNGRIAGKAVKLNKSLIPAQGDPFSGVTYKLATRDTSRRNIYWLEDIDIHGATTWHGPITIGPLK